MNGGQECRVVARVADACAEEPMSDWKLSGRKPSRDALSQSVFKYSSKARLSASLNAVP